MILDTVDVKKKGVHTRYLILLIIFIVTAVNYADRATLSIAGTEVAKELQLTPPDRRRRRGRRPGPARWGGWVTSSPLLAGPTC